MSRCAVGSKSDEPCCEEAIATYYHCPPGCHPGLELHVCEDHACEAFQNGNTVTHDDGQVLGKDADGDYAWLDEAAQ